MKKPYILVALLSIVFCLASCGGGGGSSGSGGPGPEPSQFVAAAMSAVMACSSTSSEKENVFGRAEKGDANAQFVLGHKHDTGEDVPQDYAEAAKWYRKAAEQGHAEAQFNLGILYDEGRGVRQDFAEAAKWYRKAKDQGVASVK